jgi:hypothetical protein
MWTEGSMPMCERTMFSVSKYVRLAMTEEMSERAAAVPGRWRCLCMIETRCHAAFSE